MKTFLELQQKAAEVKSAVTIWELKLNDVEMKLGKVNKHEKPVLKEKARPSYK